jgi:hypothetical protein
VDEMDEALSHVGLLENMHKIFVGTSGRMRVLA